MLTLLLACSAPSTPPTDGADTPTPDTSGTPEVVDPAPDTACGELYDPADLPAFELTFSESERAAIEGEYARHDEDKDYHPVTFTWHRAEGDESVAAHVRLKGTPYLWRGDKMQFVVSFNEADPDGRFHGARKIALDATWYEPTLLRERLAMSVLRDAGLPHSCANNATLAIDGAFYGVYANLEYVDREYLERNFGDAAAGGGLWKYGTDAPGDEEVALSETVSAYWTANDLDAVEEVADLDEIVRVSAAEAVLGDSDGYWCCGHNFYLYEHPDRGVLLLPWDLDLAVDRMPYDTRPDAAYGTHLAAILADPTWSARFVDAVEAVAAVYDPDVLDARIDAWSAQIAEAYAADPTRTHSVEEHDATIAAQHVAVRARRAYLDSWVACERGETTDADADGADVCDDCDDGDPAIRPRATELENGRDDDCDGQVDEGFDVCTEYSFDGARLLVCSSPRTWAQAVADCVAKGGVLGYPGSTEQRDTLYFQSLYTAPGDSTWWGGATDAAEEGVWLDVDGAPADIDYWGPNQPDGGDMEDCLAFHGSGGGFQDAHCEEPHPMMCRL